MKVKQIPLEQIDEASRAREDYGNLNELVNSIKNNGLIQNIAVFDKQSADDWDNHPLKVEEEIPEARYLLLAGGRRYRAFQEGSIADSIPAKIYEKHMDADEIKTIELEENLRRKNLSYEEELNLVAQIHRHYQNLHGQMEGSGMAKTGHSIRDTARKLDRSPASVSEDIKLAEAMEAVPEMFKGAKNKTDAKKILDKATKSIQEEETAQKIREKRSETTEDKIKMKIAESYINKDILEGLKAQESSTFGLVELDPPLQIGFEDIYDEDDTYDGSLNTDNYLSNMEQILKEAHRIMKSHSWIIVWYPIEPWHQPLWELMNDIGFKTRAIPLVWNKINGNSRAANYNLGNAYEVALYGRKGEPLLNKPGYNNVFTHKKPSAKKRYHKTEKPIELYMDIFEAFCRKGTNICVGYAGSGNAILAAENIDMNAIGFDTNEDLKNKFDIKAFENVPPNYTSYVESKS